MKRGKFIFESFHLVVSLGVAGTYYVFVLVEYSCFSFMECILGQCAIIWIELGQKDYL